MFESNTTLTSTTESGQILERAPNSSSAGTSGLFVGGKRFVGGKKYLDAWLVDFFAQDPGDTDISDTTSLFLLQLACIGESNS